MEGQEGPFGVEIAEKEIGQCAMIGKALGVQIGDDLTFGCIVEIPKTRSVDNRRSSSTTGIIDVIDWGLRPRGVWAGSRVGL